MYRPISNVSTGLSSEAETMADLETLLNGVILLAEWQVVLATYTVPSYTSKYIRCKWCMLLFAASNWFCTFHSQLRLCHYSVSVLCVIEVQTFVK